MTAYVVGFAFDHMNKVWLIRKNKPEWQAGKLNGIGGRIEMGETSRQAMSREFHEEAGVLVPMERWTMFHRETWASGTSVDFFVTRLTNTERPVSMTTERVIALSWVVLSYIEWTMHEGLYNMAYLVPMAFVHLTVYSANIPAHQPPSKS